MKHDADSQKAYTLLLSTLLLIAIAIRILGINQLINEDELHWAYSAQARDWFGTVMRNAPFSIYILNFFTLFLGISTWSIRLPFIITGILTILITTRLAREHYGKKTALVTATVLAINPLHTLASLQLAYEGSFLTLFFTTTLYTLFKYNHTKKKKWKWLTGIAFGLALLSKTSALLLIPPIIFVYLLLTTKKVFKTIKDTTAVLCTGILLFIVGFALPSILLKSPALINAITQLLAQTTPTPTSYILLFTQYAHALVWLGPLLVFIPLYTALTKKTNHLHTISVAYILLFYLIVPSESALPMERYLMTLTPPLAILAAQTITPLVQSLKYWLFISSLIGGILITAVPQFFTTIYPSFYPKTEYITRALNLEWNFFIPITGSSGPLGFYISFLSLALPWMFIATLFILAFLFNKKSNKRTIILTVLIGLSAGTTLFFLQEYLLPLKTPSINKISHDTTTYINQHHLPTPIYYFKNYALLFHLDAHYKKNKTQPNLPHFNYFDLSAYTQQHFKELRAKATNQPFYETTIPFSFVDDTPEKSKQLLDKLHEKGGTIAFIDFPPLSKEGQLWNVITHCNQLANFSDKNRTTGYVFDCNNLKQ